MVPTYYILFTLSTIIGSAMLYQDFYDKSADAVFFFILGCLLCFAGVALLTSGHVAPDDEYVDTQQPTADEPAEAGSTFAAERQRKRLSVRAIRQALRHLDSPLFIGRERMTSSRSLDDLYEDLNGRSALQSHSSRYMSDFSLPSKVTNAPFGGGEHARVWSLSHTSQRTVSEDGCVVSTGTARTQWRSDRRPPQIEIRRSHSAQNLRGGIETGLLDQ